MHTLADSSDGDVARAVAAQHRRSGEAAEAEIYRRFAPRVRLYGLRHLRDEDAARDLVQQVLLLTIEKLREGSVRETDRVASFVLGVSRTMVRDLKRREWRRERLREALPAAPAFALPSEEAPAELDRLERCLGQLVERERMVVLLTFYAERTAREVGAELGLAEGHVRVIRHRAITHLRQCLAAGEVTP